MGNASLIAPMVLFQQLVFLPIALVLLDISTSKRPVSIARRFMVALLNPVIVGSVGGVAVAALNLSLPTIASAPLELIGQLAIPVVLLAFGISLHGSRLTIRGPEASAIIVSVALKTLVHPAVAFVFSVFVFHLDRTATIAVTIAAALPAAQNLYAYASRLDAAATVAKSSIAVSTIVSVPIIVTIALLA